MGATEVCESGSERIRNFSMRSFSHPLLDAFIFRRKMRMQKTTSEHSPLAYPILLPRTLARTLHSRVVNVDEIF